jgi:hypothetical protein
VCLARYTRAMKRRSIAAWVAALGVAAVARVGVAGGEPPAGGGARDAGATLTRNVVIVMIDGLRWQEVFTGADERYMTPEVGKVEKPEPLRARWIRPTPHERREALMPFLWRTMAAKGQVLGNRERGSEVNITNGFGVSYPGYAEALCGVAEAFIKDNRHIMNPNPTVLEWVATRGGFEGRAAAFGAWDTFRFIFRAGACGFPVDDGTGPITFGRVGAEIETINRLRAEVPYRWSGVAFDALVVNAALAWVRDNTPRIVFVGMGETDEWAHEYDYARYLEAAHRADGYVSRLWELLQSHAEYKGVTTLLVLPDHGRGDLSQSPRAWGDHGATYAGSEHIWLAAMGPDTPALGERESHAPVTQSQVAATAAALLGLDFREGQPRAAGPVADLLGR